MKQCEQCRDERGKPVHAYYSRRDRLLRRAGGCNWLNGMVRDGRCPHCGGPLVDLHPTGLGALMDELSMFDE